MGCNVVELGYMRPRRGILESDDILAKDRHRRAQPASVAPRKPQLRATTTGVRPERRSHPESAKLAPPAKRRRAPIVQARGIAIQSGSRHNLARRGMNRRLPAESRGLPQNDA